MIIKAIKRAAAIIGISLSAVSPASANSGSEGMFSVSSIFNLILLICAIIGLLWAIRILALVRGGLMSKSWQMIVLGFACLAMAQILILGEKVNILPLPGYVATLFYILMAGTWLAGLYQTRKILD
jgi:hypothetical protein